MTAREALLGFLRTASPESAELMLDELVVDFEREVQRACADRLREAVESGEITELQRGATYACGFCDANTAVQDAADLIDPDKEVN